MKKTLKILLVVAMVGSLFAVGFAGNAAAQSRDRGDSQHSGQVAVSHVDQDQGVIQYNRNHQDDNYAVSAAVNVGGRNDGPTDAAARDRRSNGAESGDAIAVQASAQSNKNSQFAWSNAQNGNWQNQDD
ncbi:hypothetical protein [Haladaptatus sp. AB643]|uniref:hypothetical protein n=1 Tax=Haladaptatus sp. AB643 TaxID=2934174 RepID=UPI00209C0A86|nr:hypothetical protein [Haladaptatus sp. AB643]MCO8244002.1 hypothetical protein [Haladaptatus sp. AB643]